MYYYFIPVQVSTFNELVDLSGESADDDSYKALTALGILSALQSLVKATFNETQVVWGGGVMRGGVRPPSMRHR